MIVQDLFKNCNSKKVADLMLKLMSERTQDKYSKNMDIYYKTIDNTISEILSLEPILSNDYVFVSMAYSIDEDPWLATSILKTEQIIENSNLVNNLFNNFSLEEYKEKGLKIIPYSLMFVPREELLGHKFAEHSFSVFDKNEIIASVLFELTYFGYSNKDNKNNIEKEVAKLDKSVKEYEEGDLIDFDDLMEEMYGEDWEEQEEFRYTPPTQEQLDKNILDNMIPIYKEYKWILDKELA